jgi:ATP-binding cassette subfamily F protein 3
LGDYDYYVEKKLELEELKLLEQQTKETGVQKVTTSKKNSYQQDKEAKKLERQRKRRLEEIEERIELLEKKISENEELLCNPEIYQNHEKVMELNGENEQARSEIEKLMEEWAELAED